MAYEVTSLSWTNIPITFKHLKGVKETELTKDSIGRLHNSAHRCHTQYDVCTTTKTSSLR